MSDEEAISERNDVNFEYLVIDRGEVVVGERKGEVGFLFRWFLRGNGLWVWVYLYSGLKFRFFGSRGFWCEICGGVFLG